MASISIFKLSLSDFEELKASDSLDDAVASSDPRISQFESSSNVGDSHHIYSGVFMDLEVTVEECDFAGKKGLKTFLNYFGEEDFCNDYELDEEAGWVGSYSPKSLASIGKAAAQIDWAAFQETAEEEGECEVPVDVLVNYTRDLVRFLETASGEAGAVVAVRIS